MRYRVGQIVPVYVEPQPSSIRRSSSSSSSSSTTTTTASEIEMHRTRTRDSVLEPGVNCGTGNFASLELGLILVAAAPVYAQIAKSSASAGAGVGGVVLLGGMLAASLYLRPLEYGISHWTEWCAPTSLPTPLPQRAGKKEKEDQSSS